MGQHYVVLTARFQLEGFALTRLGQLLSALGLGLHGAFTGLVFPGHFSSSSRILGRPIGYRTNQYIFEKGVGAGYPVIPKGKNEVLVQHMNAEVIFKVYDLDGNGKVTFNDILEVLHDLTGSSMSDKQREDVLTQVLLEAGYTRESYLLLDDFIKILEHSDLKMEVEVPID